MLLKISGGMLNTTKEKRDAFINAGSEIEKELYQIFKKGDPIVIADIGACDGLSSIIYARMFPNAFIHAFEPRQDNFDLMFKNFEEYGIINRCEMHLCALGDRDGMVPFYRSKGQAPGVKDWDTGNKSSSVLKPKEHLKCHKWCEFDREMVVMHRLDDMHVDHIDFAHIDVQGAEAMVINGGARTLNSSKAIWIEVSNIELYENQVTKYRLVEFMCSIMKLKIVKDTCIGKRFGDILFVR